MPEPERLQKSCLWCNTQFETYYHNVKFCSKWCKAKALKSNIK